MTAPQTVRFLQLKKLWDGHSTIPQVVEYACTVEGAPLLKVTLVKLLESARFSKAEATRVARRVTSMVDSTRDPNKVTIGWLVDPRAGNRRIVSMADALSPVRLHPPARFPYVDVTAGGQ